MIVCTHHADARVHHLAVRVDWRDRTVWVDHHCEGGHSWSERAENVPAVLAKVGLCKITGVADGH
jgi:hypothetical protein